MGTGLLYVGLATSALTLDRYFDVSLASPQSYLGLARASLTLVMIVGALIQLYKLRRRVFLGITKTEAAREDFWGLDEKDVSPVSRPAASAGENRTEEKFQNLAHWTVASVFLVLVALVVIGLPIGGILQSLSGEANYFWGTNQYYSISALFWALLSTALLSGWLVVGYNPAERMSLELAFLGTAVVVNVYVGYAVWGTGAKLLRIPTAITDPHDFGLMVWWNLVDSIPLVDVDSALGWEKPLDQYGASIGWLFLLQRLVLLATLARAIQIVVNRVLSRGPRGKSHSSPSS